MLRNVLSLFLALSLIAPVIAARADTITLVRGLVDPTKRHYGDYSCSVGGTADGSVVVAEMFARVGGKERGVAYIYPAERRSKRRVEGDPAGYYYAHEVAGVGDKIVVTNGYGTDVFSQRGKRLRTDRFASGVAGQTLSLAPMGGEVLIGGAGWAPGFPSFLIKEVHVVEVESGNVRLVIRDPSGQPAGETTAFGRGLAGGEGWIAIGNDLESGQVEYGGVAYVYDAISGDLLRTLSPPNPTAFDLFGWALAIGGGRIYVGAPNVDLGATTNAGAVHVFDAATGDFVETLQSSHPVDRGHFGYALAVVGSRIVVGAPGVNITTLGEAPVGEPPPPYDPYWFGSVDVFDAATGVHVGSYRPVDYPYSFGRSVAAAGGNIVVGGGARQFGISQVAAAEVLAIGP